MPTFKNKNKRFSFSAGAASDKKSSRFSFTSSSASKKENKTPATYADTLQNRISNYETRFNAISAQAPEPEDKRSTLLKVLDVIDRPRNAIVNAIQDTSKGENGVWQGLKEGFTGKEHAYVSDLLDPNTNKYAKGALGFVGDVLLDPVTYLTVGTAGVAKGAAGGVAREVSKTGAQKVLKFAGKEIPGSAKVVTPIANRTNAIWQATGIPETFSTKAIRGASKMSGDELAAVQKVADLTRHWGQQTKGKQLQAAHDIAKEWAGVSKQAAEEVPGIIEAPKELMRKTGTNELTGIDAVAKLGLNSSEQGMEAADIAKRITADTSMKDISAGVEFTEIPDYIKHLYQNQGELKKAWLDFKKTVNTHMGRMSPNKKASFQKQRKYSTLAEFEEYAAEKGYSLQPIKDARVLTTVREMEGVYKRESTKLFSEIAKLGDNVLIDADKAPKEWAQIPGVKQFEGKKLHPEAARHLDRALNIQTSFEAQSSLGKLADAIQNVWKGLVTTSVPFHIRNAGGNIYHNFLAGVVNPNLYAMAAAIQKGSTGKFVLNGAEYTGEDLMRLFREQGLEGFGIFKGESLDNITEEAMKLYGGKKAGLNAINPLSQDFAPVKGSRWLGDKIETNAKLAHFIDKLAKGYNPEEAAESVRKYLFDYADLTPTEQKIKKFIPFYTWTRKNIPLQLESLITQPGKATALNKLSNSMKNTQDVEDSDMPDWMREEMAIPLYINDEGNQIYLMPDLPITNLNMFGGGDTARNMLGMLSPLVKVPIEIGMNQQIFSGAPIEKYPGAQTNVGGVNIPSKAAYALSQLGSMPRSAMNIAGSLSQQQPAGDSLIPEAPKKSALQELVLGGLLRPVDPERQEIFNLMDRDEQLSNYRKLLEDVRGIEVPTINELTANKKKTTKRFSWN